MENKLICDNCGKKQEDFFENKIKKYKKLHIWDLERGLKFLCEKCYNKMAKKYIIKCKNGHLFRKDFYEKCPECSKKIKKQEQGA